MNFPTVYFSNQLEELARLMGEQIRLSSKDPFRRQMVLIPHHNLKFYLSSFFAQEDSLGISIAIEYKSLLDGVGEYLPLQGKVRSVQTLSVLLEKELTSLVENRLLPIENITEKDLAWFAEELAPLFYEYAVWEPEAREKFLAGTGWKQDLWHKVFSKGGPCQDLVMQEADGRKREDMEIYLFGFAYVPKHILSILYSGPIHVFFLSASGMFWEDLCTDREKIFLQKKMIEKKIKLQVQEQIRTFLHKAHPLLANWGKVGRKFLAELGQRESYLEESYIVPQAGTLLSYLQEDLLLLEEQEKKRKISSGDTSVLCINASSKLREVEILLDTLQELLASESEDSLTILVYSVDLAAYAPHIHAIFSQKHCPLDYAIHGLTGGSSPDSRALETFFSLAESRFEKDRFLRFLKQESVSKKWELTLQEISWIEKWASRTGVVWGIDQEHKNAFLSELSTSQGSWLASCESIILGLCIELKEEQIFPGEVQAQNLAGWMEAEALGKLTHILRSLKEDLRPIYQKDRRSLTGWILLVEKLLATYLMPSKDQERLLEYLRRMAEDVSEDFLLAFSSFKRFIEKYFQQRKESFQSSYLHAVRFLPLEPGGIYPASIIYVLGCDEESIPKSGKISSFDEYRQWRQSPSRAEQDRYMFLDLILNARKSLIFSYERVSSKDLKSQSYSRMVGELLSYIEARYELDFSLVRTHPALHFSREYFQDGPIPRSHSPFLFDLAKSFYGDEKTPPAPFLPVQTSEANSQEIPLSLDLYKLQDFAKNPPKFYCKEVLGMFFEFIEPRDKEFFLSPLAKSQIKKRALGYSLDGAVRKAQAQGSIPKNSWGKLGEADLIQEIEGWGESLKEASLSEESLWQLELIPGLFAVQRKGKSILAPGLELEVNGKSISLQGVLFPVTDKGILLLDDSIASIIALWPALLVFFCMAEKIGCQGQGLFLENGKSFSLGEKDPQIFLARYVELYLRAFNEPCLLQPKWMESLLRLDEKQLEEKVSRPLFETGFEDSFDLWLQRRQDPLTAQEMLGYWKEGWADALLALKGGEL